MMHLTFEVIYEYIISSNHILIIRYSIINIEKLKRIILYIYIIFNTDFN